MFSIRQTHHSAKASSDCERPTGFRKVGNCGAAVGFTCDRPTSTRRRCCFHDDINESEQQLELYLRSSRRRRWQCARSQSQYLYTAKYSRSRHPPKETWWEVDV